MLGQPGTDLPPELETGPISQPISAPNQFGGAIAGAPTLPAGEQAIRDAAQYARFHDTVRTLPPGAPLPGALPPAPVPPPPPLATPPLGTAPPPEAVPPVAVPRGAGGGGGAGGRPAKTDTLQTDINKIGQQEEVGIQKTQDAKLEASDRLSKAQTDLAVQIQADAAEQAEQTEIRRQANDHAEAQEREALQKARDYTIPDFWQGHEGARVGSVISVAMGSIASAITGGPNGALQTINKYTDDYFHKQKEKIDNLYKYAEQTGRLNDRTRIRYAQELTQLQAQHLAVQQSIITRIEAVKTQNQGLVDQASTDELLAKAKADQVKRVEDYKVNQAHISLMGAQANAANANAAESRAKAAAAKATAGGTSPKLLLQLSGQVQQQIDKDPEAKETFKALHKYEEAQSALKSGTGIGDKLVIDEITKAATGLGARPQSIKVFEQATGSAWERLKGDIQKLQTGKALTPDQSANVAKFLDYTINEKRSKLNNVRERIKSGMLQNPAYKGQPDVIEGALSQHFGTPSASPAPAAAPVSQLVTIRNGRTGETKQVTREEAQRLGAI